MALREALEQNPPSPPNSIIIVWPAARFRSLRICTVTNTLKRF